MHSKKQIQRKGSSFEILSTDRGPLSLMIYDFSAHGKKKRTRKRTSSPMHLTFLQFFTALRKRQFCSYFIPCRLLCEAAVRGCSPASSHTQVKVIVYKAQKILKGSLDLIPSLSHSVKIQIMGGKVCLRCKGKTLLGIVNKLLKTQSLLTSSNILPYHLK